MRDLINIVAEDVLSKSEQSMIKHNDAHLTTLLQNAKTQAQVEINPKKRTQPTAPERARRT
jgi:hypothetical protein